MVFLGQNPEELETLALELDIKAQEIEGITGALTAKIAATTWQGPDRIRFEENWNTHLAQALRQVASALTETAVIARSNAAQQLEASA